MLNLQSKKLFSLSFLSNVFMCFFVVFVIFPVKFLVSSSSIYSSGGFVPFVSQYLYAADICFLLGMLFAGLHLIFDNGDKFQCKNVKFDRNLLFLSGFLVFFAFISLFFSINFENSFFSLVRFLEFFVLYLLLIFDFIRFKSLIIVFLGAILFSSLIGLMQFIFQHSLNFKFLGESVVSNSMVGVAKLDFGVFKLLRVYGTFAHPNIFSGFLAISLIFVYIFYKNEFFLRNKFSILILFVLLTVFLLTFSKTTLVAFILLPFFLFPKKFTTKMKLFLISLAGVLLVLALISEVTALERLRFLSISNRLFLDKPFGVGLGNFTEAMSQFSFYKLFPWNYQPVHNVFLLALNEIGFSGFIVFFLIFGYVIYETLKSKEYILFALIFVLLIIALFDHYLLSLYQGQFLFWFILAYITKSRNQFICDL